MTRDMDLIRDILLRLERLPVQVYPRMSLRSCGLLASPTIHSEFVARGGR
jgi:hypothetical protein